MPAFIPRPRQEITSSLEVAAERRRLARIALRRHWDETAKAARAAHTEEQRCRAAIAACDAEVDALLDELAAL